jgi:LPXTG-motif cell wall-anchored protein
MKTLFTLISLGTDFFAALIVAISGSAGQYSVHRDLAGLTTLPKTGGASLLAVGVGGLLVGGGLLFLVYRWITR